MPTVQIIADLRGPAGRLEALLTSGSGDAPFAALVAHPHPLGGGTMHNKVVYHAAKSLSHFGLPVLRFNFRGTGLSEGTHDHGHGEVHDVHAALDWLAARFPTKSFLVAGFSFGANVALRAACSSVDSHRNIQGLIGIGLPVRAADRDYTYDFLATCGPVPKLFLSGDHDEFSPRGTLESFLTAAPEPKTLIWIPGADHFFAGTPTSPASKLPLFAQELRSWLARTYPQLTPVP